MLEWKWYRHRADLNVRYKARPMPGSQPANVAVQTNPEDPRELAYLPAWMFAGKQAIYELEEE